MIGVSWDITEIRKAQEQLASEKSRLSYILEGTNVGTWEWNVQTGETVFNERWANIIGYSLEEISPVSIDTWVKFVHPDDLKTSGDLLEKHFKGELDYYECESRMLHKNGSWVWVLDRGKVSTRSEDGKPLLVAGTHQDITARKNAEERILHLATHDALTDLPRPVVAKDRALMALSLARRNEKSFAVMFVDLDGFKKVNDNYGHDAGDTVLKEVAKRLCSGVRQTDTVARIGGDEFLVILTELQEAGDAGRVAKKLIRIVSQPVAVGSAHLSIGCSIGIATYPTNGGNIDQLIKLADDAMYSVKNAGKNGFAFADGNGKASADEDGAGLGSDPFRG
jgi:diguanylate cyclase (GGDEF)-like protein/PAS domain S-box-containing protein